MSNQYPHQQEMEAITQRLLDYVVKHSVSPMNAIREFSNKAIHALDTSSDDMDKYEDWYVLSDLEEAVVLKNFALKYQKKYRYKLPDGQERT